ncbi:MAG: hypothetical protein M1819_006259 [Sarea resinae]|nr:MAG: hypothetical protein M1819_006259 [Sarea resinae]
MRANLDTGLLSSVLLLPSLTLAMNIGCEHVRVDKKSFDLSPLSGPHAVSYSYEQPPSIINTTFTIDICQPLKRPKSVPKTDTCQSGTRVCAVERAVNIADHASAISRVIPIAGDFIHDSLPLEPQWTRLKSSPSNADADKEGIRLEMHGGRYPFTHKDGVQQKAIVEFLCDETRTGLEGDELGNGRNDDDDDDDDEDEDDDDDKRRLRERATKGTDEKGDDEKKPSDEQSLRFVKYGKEGDIDVLRLEWLTKYACESRKNKDDSKGGSSSGHWGFFTWFIIVLFLAIASYLIFGSWLNYNRYGARGWDLLPHGDTIRDIPYLLKDWSRNVINTVQGGGSRGGYSAV